jgi:hypothetical protein
LDFVEVIEAARRVLFFRTATVSPAANRDRQLSFPD